MSKTQPKLPLMTTLSHMGVADRLDLIRGALTVQLSATPTKDLKAMYRDIRQAFTDVGFNDLTLHIEAFCDKRGYTRPSTGAEWVAMAMIMTMKPSLMDYRNPERALIEALIERGDRGAPVSEKVEPMRPVMDLSGFDKDFLERASAHALHDDGDDEAHPPSTPDEIEAAYQIALKGCDR